jgi:hypothetical protein
LLNQNYLLFFIEPEVTYIQYVLSLFLFYNLDIKPQQRPNDLIVCHQFLTFIQNK